MLLRRGREMDRRQQCADDQHQQINLHIHSRCAFGIMVCKH